MIITIGVAIVILGIFGIIVGEVLDRDLFRVFCILVAMIGAITFGIGGMIQFDKEEALENDTKDLVQEEAEAALLAGARALTRTTDQNQVRSEIVNAHPNVRTVDVYYGPDGSPEVLLVSVSAEKRDGSLCAAMAAEAEAKLTVPVDKNVTVSELECTD